jgi:DnaJ-class molecular chaperone
MKCDKKPKRDVYYNYFFKKYIVILDGEKVCSKCKGKGVVLEKNFFKMDKSMALKCSDCLGDGKLDWVDVAMGKSRPHGANNAKS